MHPRLLESPDSPLRGVRLWTARIESLSVAEIEELRAHLDSVEHARAARFHFERDRQSYVATRGLLRCLLGATLHEEASKLVFEYGERGKPSLAVAGQHGPAIHFSVSHSAGWAMFAVARGLEVGIDLEAADRLDRSDESLSQLAARILSAGELAVWQALPDAAARGEAFLRAWTRKEAYAKATGRGLFEQLTCIEAALDAAAPKSSLVLRSSIQEGEITRHWVLHDLSAPDGFAAALAVEQKLKQDA